MPFPSSSQPPLAAVGFRATPKASSRTSGGTYFHALRHTFQTSLDRKGCSRATRKALRTHAAEDVTDGYAHAALAELLAALVRIPSPDTAPKDAQVMATGSSEVVAGNGSVSDDRLDHGPVS